MAYADENLVRLVVTLPPEERDSFDRAARYGGQPKLSMTVAARELFRMFAAGKVPMDRKGAQTRARRRVGK